MAAKPATLTPLASLRVSKFQIPASSKGPNTSISNKPLLIYHSAFPTSSSPSSSSSPVSASSIESHLRHIGVVDPHWRYTMYDTSHFHTTSHEVLCVSSGRAKVCFGGEDNPGRIEPVVQQGDVMILPAGVAHRLLEDLDGRFQMVGSYPSGRSWDMCYGGGRAGEEAKVRNIAKLPWFTEDPIYGKDGPVLQV